MSRDPGCWPTICLDKIAEMADVDRDLAERVHAIVTTTVSDVVVKTYYGMPAYARENGKVVCWFKAAAKFKTIGKSSTVLRPVRCVSKNIA